MRRLVSTPTMDVALPLLGWDPKVLATMPAAIGATLGVFAYSVGVLRPLRVVAGRSWHEHGVVHFSCTIKNRTLLWDRTVSAVQVFLLDDERRGILRRASHHGDLTAEGAAIDA